MSETQYNSSQPIYRVFIVRPFLALLIETNPVRSTEKLPNLVQLRRTHIVWPDSSLRSPIDIDEWMPLIVARSPPLDPPEASKLDNKTLGRFEWHQEIVDKAKPQFADSAHLQDCKIARSIRPSLVNSRSCKIICTSSAGSSCKCVTILIEGLRGGAEVLR